MPWKNDFSPITPTTTLFWFRRDLRIADNAGLYNALKNNDSVLPLFIFDTNILNKLEDRSDARVGFILQSLEIIKHDLEARGSSILILYGDPVKLFERIRAKAVYANHDYEPYARERDHAVGEMMAKKGRAFSTFKDQVIFERSEVVKEDGSPYTVYTPFSRKWRAKLNKFYMKSYPSEKYADKFHPCKPLPFPSLQDIGFTSSNVKFPPRLIKKSVIETYDKTRNFPAVYGTTHLGVHLRFGTVSIRKLVQIANKKNQTWLNELIWREFYQMILWHFPHVQTQSFKTAYDRIRWRNSPEEFELWCSGQTGYPIVDAGMRELNATGFMHNRVRMIVASFLSKHLLIDWRWGEAYFAKKLLDYDLAANNGGWQWAAGSGCDAAPYFRIFNPSLQSQKFDKEMKYIRQWVPEVETEAYPKPMVEHGYARNRALRQYKEKL